MHQSILVFLFFFFSGCQILSPHRDKEKAPLEKPEKITKKEQMRIGLFISDAGANTFSAIPILELLQKEKIAFSAVGGTGWGAWIAALYAKDQSVDELKWNLFKLKEQGVFGTKWFSNKRKRVKILKKITNEALSSTLPIPFICPFLSNRNHISWMTEIKITQSVFSCLHKLPPLFFSLKKTGGQGSLFSVAPLLEYMEQVQGVELIIWIKPSILLQSTGQSPAFSLFWKELSAYMNSLKEGPINNPNRKIFLLEINQSISFLDDFSKLNAILKSSVPFLLKQKVYRLKQQIYP